MEIKPVNLCCTMAVTCTLAAIFGIYAFDNPDDESCYVYKLDGLAIAEKFKPVAFKY